MIADECPSLGDKEKQLVFADNAERFVRNQMPEPVKDRAGELHRKSTVIVIHDHRPIAPDVPLMLAGGVTAKVYQVGVDVEIGPDYRASATKRDGWKAAAQASLEEARRVIVA